MIDPTTQQSAAYSKLIEAPGVTQDEIDAKVREILRGLSALDVTDALHDIAVMLREDTLYRVPEDITGRTVQGAIWAYCESIAKRELDA